MSGGEEVSGGAAVTCGRTVVSGGSAVEGGFGSVVIPGLTDVPGAATDDAESPPLPAVPLSPDVPGGSVISSSVPAPGAAVCGGNAAVSEGIAVESPELYRSADVPPSPGRPMRGKISAAVRVSAMSTAAPAAAMTAVFLIVPLFLPISASFLK